jgi:hypothetical protein
MQCFVGKQLWTAPPLSVGDLGRDLPIAVRREACMWLPEEAVPEGITDSISSADFLRYLSRHLFPKAFCVFISVALAMQLRCGDSRCESIKRGQPAAREGLLTSASKECTSELYTSVDRD